MVYTLGISKLNIVAHRLTVLKYSLGLTVDQRPGFNISCKSRNEKKAASEGGLNVPLRISTLANRLAAAGASESNQASSEQDYGAGLGHWHGGNSWYINTRGGSKRKGRSRYGGCGVNARNTDNERRCLVQKRIVR